MTTTQQQIGLAESSATEQHINDVLSMPLAAAAVLSSPTTAPAIEPFAPDPDGEADALPLARENFFQFVARTAKELRYVKFALASFIVNNLRRRYRRSVLGFAWSLLNPMFTMLVLTAVFSLLFHQNPRTFAIFVFTGLLPWIFITDAITNGSQSIVAAEPFLKKVYIPKLFFPLVAVGTEAVNFALSLVSLIALGVCLSMPISPALLVVPAAIALLSVFNLSIAVILAIGTVYFRDLTHIIKIVLGALFYLVPIIYPISQIPVGYRQFFLLNPVYYFINLFRLSINECTMPNMHDWAIPTVVAISLLALSLCALKKTERDLIYRL